MAKAREEEEEEGAAVPVCRVVATLSVRRVRLRERVRIARERVSRVRLRERARIGREGKREV